MRKELRIGILLWAISMLLNHFVQVPEFISGLLLGGALSLEIIGMLPEKTYSKLKDFKRKIVRRIKSI